MSSKGLAISEKHSDEPFGEESRVGIPFNFLMRDVLQFDNSLQNATKYASVNSFSAHKRIDVEHLLEYSSSVFDKRLVCS